MTSAMTSCGDSLNSTPAETKVEPYGLSLLSQRKTDPNSEMSRCRIMACHWNLAYGSPNLRFMHNLYVAEIYRPGYLFVANRVWSILIRFYSASYWHIQRRIVAWPWSVGSLKMLPIAYDLLLVCHCNYSYICEFSTLNNILTLTSTIYVRGHSRLL